MDESLVKPVVARLWSTVKPGGMLLAFFHTQEAGPDAPCYRYHIVGNDASKCSTSRPRRDLRKGPGGDHSPIEKTAFACSGSSTTATSKTCSATSLPSSSSSPATTSAKSWSCASCQLWGGRTSRSSKRSKESPPYRVFRTRYRLIAGIFPSKERRAYGDLVADSTSAGFSKTSGTQVQAAVYRSCDSRRTASASEIFPQEQESGIPPPECRCAEPAKFRRRQRDPQNPQHRRPSASRPVPVADRERPAATCSPDR